MKTKGEDVYPDHASMGTYRWECDNCGKKGNVEDVFHCNGCNFYDLCIDCYEERTGSVFGRKFFMSQCFMLSAEYNSAAVLHLKASLRDIFK